jgi:hypothetical protein
MFLSFFQVLAAGYENAEMFECRHVLNLRFGDGAHRPNETQAQPRLRGAQAAARASTLARVDMEGTTPSEPLAAAAG